MGHPNLHPVIVFSERDVAATAVAEQQLGLLTTADLNRCGITRTGITRRVKSGVLHRIRLGVYRYAGTPRFADQRLVEEAFAVDATAAVSHDTAAHLWGLVSKEPTRIHVVVRRWRREIRTSAVVHESLDFVPRDRVLHNGIPVTDPVRTVVDLGATSKWLVESALSRGIRSELFTIQQVNDFVRRVARRGRRGVGVIRPLLEHYGDMGSTESVLEDRFWHLLKSRPLPLPLAQFDVVDGNGQFVCRADFAYPDRHLLIELDGRSYHADPAAFQSDRDKQNRTQALGWTTLRFTWFDVTQRPDFTAATIHRTLRVLA